MDCSPRIMGLMITTCRSRTDSYQRDWADLPTTSPTKKPARLETRFHDDFTMKNPNRMIPRHELK